MKGETAENSGEVIRRIPLSEDNDFGTGCITEWLAITSEGEILLLTTDNAAVESKDMRIGDPSEGYYAEHRHRWIPLKRPEYVRKLRDALTEFLAMVVVNEG